MTFDFDFLLLYTLVSIHYDLPHCLSVSIMSTDPTDDKGALGKVSEEPHGEAEHDSADHPRVKKKRLGVDPSLIISNGRSKRHKTPTPTPGVDVKKEVGAGDLDPKDSGKAAEAGREIYQKVLAMKDKE